MCDIAHLFELCDIADLKNKVLGRIQMDHAWHTSTYPALNEKKNSERDVSMFYAEVIEHACLGNTVHIGPLTVVQNGHVLFRYFKLGRSVVLILLE